MDPKAFAFLAAGIGVGLSVIGAGIGIGKLAAAALEAAGRQPEAIGKLQTMMIIPAVLIEGVALIAEIFSLLFVIL